MIMIISNLWTCKLISYHSTVPSLHLRVFFRKKFLRCLQFEGKTTKSSQCEFLNEVALRNKRQILQILKMANYDLLVD